MVISDGRSGHDLGMEGRGGAGTLGVGVEFGS